MSVIVYSKLEMDSQTQQLHFVLFPFMAQGHMIPMVDIAKLLAHHGVIVTIITTPLNANRFATTLDRARELGLQIHLIQLQFPGGEVGLPKDCENLDSLPSLGLALKLYNACYMFQDPVERLFEELKPRPNCIISDMSLPYTSRVANKFGIPRISFNGFSCFCQLCMHKVAGVDLDGINSDSEYFVVPGLPDHIELTKKQLPLASVLLQDLVSFSDQVAEAETSTYGMIFNTFEELEAAYVKECKKTKQDKVWCVGPVSLINKDDKDKAQRGNYSASLLDRESECLKFLNSHEPKSVIYVCLGSLYNHIQSQLIELGMGLEASNKPFIWVIKEGEKSKEIEKWMKEKEFQERNKGRGLIIQGWAPQVVILSHPAIGGFLTHCGWNSTLEGISAGVPMVTWPMFGDQFCNERLVVDVLKIGVKVGAEATVRWGEEEKIGVQVKREDVKRSVEMLMDEEVVEREGRRERAQKLSEIAKGAIEKGGSSHRTMELLIQDIMRQSFAS